MRVFSILIFLVCGLCCSGIGWASGDESTVVGVFGISAPDSIASIVVWVPVTAGEVLSGVRWYNNDENSTFSKISAVAGEYGEFDDLGSPMIVCDDVWGGSLAWSTVEFDPGVTTDCGGIYVVFSIPHEDKFIECGMDGGCGVGVLDGDGIVCSWISASGETWNPVSGEYKMAVEIVADGEKCDNVAFLYGAGGPVSGEEIEVLPVDGDILVGGGNNDALVYPNPFNPKVNFDFSVSSPSVVMVAVYNLRGQEIRVLKHEFLSAGQHSVVWDGTGEQGARVSSGVYFFKLVADWGITMHRVTLIK